MPVKFSLKRIRAELARRSYLRFMQYVWWMSTPFLVGPHTRAIAERLDEAIADFCAGKSTFLIIKCPFRHGKSDLVSRAFPPYFLARCADLDPDIIMSGYGSELVESFSRKAKSIINSRQYRSLFPHVVLSRLKNAVSKWGIEGSGGEVTAVGLGGAITGSGGHVIILDDYCKKREEAESEVYRNKMWESFKDDLMTRRAPVSIVIVCATPWHTDDIIGRIEREIRENAEFPRFDTISFPAQSNKYPSGFLFPERFDEEWYRSQRATLGAYSAAGLLDCNPVLRSGNMFKVDLVQVHDSLDEFPDIPYVRFWDLASTKKERVKDDPDRTAGPLLGVQRQGIVDHVWIKDLVVMQEEAPKRNARIIATTARDGAEVRIGVESVAGYKDTYTTLHDILKGQRTVTKVNVSSDKVVRAAPLEPVFEAGHFHILRADWNVEFVAEFGVFPSGKHDDIVDAVSGGYEMLKQPDVVAVSDYDPFPGRN